MDIDDFDDVTAEEVYTEGDAWDGGDAEVFDSGEYDDFLSQYDDDPSPYDGTYSEE